MLKLIHAADFHLDAPFAALSATRAAARREEQRELLSRLADLAEKERADLLLLSGDILDGPLTRRETVEALARTLSGIRARVFIAPGNHDFWSPRSPWAGTAWPDNVHIFSTETVETVEIPALGCTVSGAAFTGPYLDTSPLAGFSAPQDGRIHLMVLHADVDNRGRYAPLPESEIAGSGLTYLALGHVHACSGLRRAGKTVWAYPGCPEGRGFDELGEKGVLAGTVEPGDVRLDFVPLCRRRYEILPVDLTGAADPAAALSAALPADAEEDIYRILLTGESDVAGLDIPALTNAAAPYFYAVTLRDNTTVRRSLWERAEEDNLTGLFLRRMKSRLDGAQTEEERALAEKAVRFGLAALENGEDCCP